jgi:hypothetical protein
MSSDSVDCVVWLSPSEFQAACDAYEGICVECKEITNSGVEPDARAYECESCGGRTVYGMEEALLMGLIAFTAEPQ